MPTRNYDAEDIQQILAIAMAKDIVKESQLKEMAAELSVDDASLQYAIDAWQQQKVAAQKKHRQRQRFYRWSLFPYLAVNTFLIVLNISIAGTVTWAIYPLLGWGVGLLLELGGWGGCSRVHSTKAKSLLPSEQLTKLTS